MANEEASPICRGKNLSWETVLLFYNNMPRDAMPKAQFNSYVEARINGWTQTHSQIARQLAFYYELDGICYPRFSANTKFSDLFVYMQNWASKYFIPNPYAPSLKGYKPTCIYAYLKHKLNNGISDFDEALDSMFDIKLSSHDKVNVYLSNFTDLIIDNNHKLLCSDGEFVQCTDAKLTETVATNAEAYFKYFDNPFENKSCLNKQKLNFLPLQQIYYGAPGTGKSNEIRVLTGKGKDGIKFEKDYTFRVTFHPDSDYSTFVGAYKPTTYNPEGSSERKITYDFRPQAFIKAYINAWLHPDKLVALVIEEINRGNCAQVFGDIFQLLDRHKEGLSKYPIEADVDMKGFIARAFEGEIAEFGTEQLPEENKATINQKYQDHYDNAFDKIKNGEILALPTNLSILATMNTSDQSLFPMDSAFKRRWEWIYVPIKNHNKDWKIEVGEFEIQDEEGNTKKETKFVDWWQFLEKINKVIFNLTDSEDKQLGYHFIHLEDDEKIINNDTFVSKVIFYLWNDVFKDYGYEPDCCKSKDKKEKVSFAKFYKNDSPKLKVDAEVLKVFFEQLGFKNEEFETTPVTENAPAAPAPANEADQTESNTEDAPIIPAPADEEGQLEGNAEDGSDNNETEDSQTAETPAEPAHETTNEASNTATGGTSVNPDETANG